MEKENALLSVDEMKELEAQILNKAKELFESQFTLLYYMII